MSTNENEPIDDDALEFTASINLQEKLEALNKAEAEKKDLEESIEEQPIEAQPVEIPPIQEMPSPQSVPSFQKEQTVVKAPPVIQTPTVSKSESTIPPVVDDHQPIISTNEENLIKERAKVLASFMSESKIVEYKINSLLQKLNSKNPQIIQLINEIKRILAEHSNFSG